MGITQFAKKNAMKSKKRPYMFHELSPPFSSPGVSLSLPQKGNIVHFEKHCARIFIKFIRAVKCNNCDF